MILTGRALKDFEKWIKYEGIFLGIHPYEGRENKIEELGENFQYTLMIEWFDSVEIEIFVMNLTDYKMTFDIYYGNDIYECRDGFESRLEATAKAIEKANEIYNEKTK